MCVCVFCQNIYIYIYIYVFCQNGYPIKRLFPNGMGDLFLIEAKGPGIGEMTLPIRNDMFGICV